MTACTRTGLDESRPLVLRNRNEEVDVRPVMAVCATDVNCTSDQRK